MAAEPHAPLRQPGQQDGAGVSGLAGERALHMRTIPANSRGEDFRSLLGPWLGGVTDADVHEPLLADEWQRETLVFLLETFRLAHVRRVVVYTRDTLDDAGAVGDRVLAGMEGICATYTALGVAVAVKFQSFHRRRIVLYRSDQPAIEVWLDRGPMDGGGLTATPVASHWRPGVRSSRP